MYAVIMAGGGGTRLHPLSRPERPKPFLPLLGGETLLQATARRLGSLTGDITVVTDRRYERLVRDQLPDVALLLEPMGRNTAAAIALATAAIDRPDGRGHARHPGRCPYRARSRGRRTRASCGSRPPTWRPVHSASRTRSSHSGTQVTRPATEYGYLLPDLGRGEDVGPAEAPIRAYPLQAFEEKPKPARAEDLFERVAGAAWNAGMFLWRRQAIRSALLRYTGLVQSLEPMAGAPQLLERAYEAIQQPLSIDHAVMEGAARNGQVVMASMDVGWSDLGSWSALLAAIGARGDGTVDPARRDRLGRARRPRRPPRRRSIRGHRPAGAR